MRGEREEIMQGMLNELKDVVKYYDKFSHVAENLVWVDIEEQHEYWFRTYPLGIALDMYTFPDKYISNDIASAYVRACLSGMAFYEEWDRNFWDISQAERVQCLTKGRTMYASYAIVRDVRMIEREWDYLVREIEFFAGRNGIPVSEQRKCLERFENADVIEIGGRYSGDYEYLAVKQDHMLWVSCGCWD